MIQQAAPFSMIARHGIDIPAISRLTWEPATKFKGRNSTTAHGRMRLEAE
jgi:hypothetical protein